MRIGNSQLGMVLQTVQRAESQAPTALAALHQAGGPAASQAAGKAAQAPAPAGQNPHSQGGSGTGGEGGAGGMLRAASRSMRYALGLAGAAYIYDKSVNNFFLSTTSLHDGKGGFTSNERLDRAGKAANDYFRRYHAGGPGEPAPTQRSMPLVRTCGNNQFATMTDYRAATKVHVMHLIDTEQAHQSLATNLACLKGDLVKPEQVAKYAPSHVPADPDLTKSDLYDQKNKYALTGVPNEETGASGYASRSITRPFVLKGYQHFKDVTAERGLTPRQSMESLEGLLGTDRKLGPDAQFAAGRAVLNFRQVYAQDQHWGHAENVIMKTLAEHGLLSLDETGKLDESLMFEDPSKNILKRNTGVAGPLLHKLEARAQAFRLRDDPAALADLQPMAASKNMENLAIAHFKLNEQGNGFEDSSGLGDSFTSANVAACINHARLMSGEARMSREDVLVLVGCLNAVYDDASGIRHTLQEVARGCFAGAGYSVADADRFYEDVCKQAAEEFYGGKNLARNAAGA